MRVSKKSKKPAAPEPSSKRKRDIEEDGGSIFYQVEDEGNHDTESEDSEDGADKETAEQKRLRLAKAYLEQLKADVEEENAARDGEAGEDDVRTVIAKKLKQDVDESKYWLDRQLACKVLIPAEGAIADPVWKGRGSRLSVTSLAVTTDDRTAYSVSKCGMIFKWDVETGQRTKLSFGLEGPEKVKFKGTRADWVKKPPARVPKSSLIASAVSSDGLYLAVGGGDSQVHIFDLRSEKYIKAFSGHKDAVAGLAFREGTHELFSASFDKTVKCWSLDDMGYLDTLFGHQAEVLSIDMLRTERAVTSAADRTCRIWKIEESSQLVFRSPEMASDCCRYLNPGTFLSGSQSTLHLWNQTKKKPVFSIENAHSDSSCGPGRLDDMEATWIQSLSTCKGADLLVSGAGDGLVRLWEVQKQSDNRFSGLRKLSSFGIRGFVNALHISRNGEVIVAGVGQEPRLGRWAVDKQAKNGVVAFRVNMSHDT